MSSQESYVKYMFVSLALSAGKRSVSFEVRGLIWCAYVGRGLVRTPVEEQCAGFFIC